MDEKKFQSEFLSFKQELLSFLFRLITNREEAEDIAQDTYLKSLKKLSSFKGKSSLKTWVFAIATNLAKDSFRVKQRWGEDWQDLGKEYNLRNEHILEGKIRDSQISEHGKFVIREHINFCFTCINKTLLLTNQVCLLLKEVYDFKIREIVLITGLTEGKVKHALADSRKEMVRIFNDRCSLINKKGICHQCTELNNRFNPSQDAKIQANKLKMVKGASKTNHLQLLKLRLELVKGINPLNAEGTGLHNYILENCPDWAKEELARKAKARS